MFQFIYVWYSSERFYNTNLPFIYVGSHKGNLEDSYTSSSKFLSIEMALDERFYTLTKEEHERIKKMAELNLQIKYKNRTFIFIFNSISSIVSLSFLFVDPAICLSLL